jgi:Arc/MetJ-type ribon-helix-helix transcriptional regulator
MGASNKAAVRQESVSIGSKIAPAVARQIRELIDASVYLNESDFIRDAISAQVIADQSHKMPGYRL